MSSENRNEAIPEYLAPRKGELVMFENPLLERLSRISPVTVLAVFVPGGLLTFYQGLHVGTDLTTGAWLFLAGIFGWTPFEYLLHRFVFHYYPDWKPQQKLQFTMHGVHHQYPNDKDRLVMPVTVSIPLSVLLQTLLLHICGVGIVAAFTIFLSARLNSDASLVLSLILTSVSLLLVPRIPAFLAAGAGSRSWLLEACYYALPHLELFDMRQRLLFGYGPLPLGALIQLLLYADALCAMFLLLSWLAYRGKVFTRTGVE